MQLRCKKTVGQETIDSQTTMSQIMSHIETDKLSENCTSNEYSCWETNKDKKDQTWAANNGRGKNYDDKIVMKMEAIEKSSFPIARLRVTAIPNDLTRLNINFDKEYFNEQFNVRKLLTLNLSLKWLLKMSQEHNMSIRFMS